MMGESQLDQVRGGRHLSLSAFIRNIETKRPERRLTNRCSEPRTILMPSFFTYAKVTCNSRGR
jgi:hypothetical protein